MNASDSQVDHGILVDLLGEIEDDPSNIEAKRLLAQHYASVGWIDAATEYMKEVLQLCPDDQEAQDFLLACTLAGREAVRTPKRQHISRPAAAASTFKGGAIPGVRVQELEQGYQALMEEAAKLFLELQIYQELCPKINLNGQIADIKTISEGRLTAVIKITPPPNAPTAAFKIKDSEDPVEATFTDLESYARYSRHQMDPTNDKLRDELKKRSQDIKSSLPRSLQHVAQYAFMHVEHELLGKEYQNGTETMYGDLIASIPRSKFWVSEDGYAWDMSELAEALKANGGRMRNPLSKSMFTAEDAKDIIRHPLGKDLAAMQLHQQQLTNGIRAQTIDVLESMSQVLLKDQSDDAAESRQVVDEFLSYAATLPDEEQNALHQLRVPATDSHTGQQYDGSIGAAIADGKANRQCFHKVGDYVNQAAKYLRTQNKNGKRRAFY